jgi:two-component system cell cycle response regulator
MTARVLVVDDVDANLKLLALEICLSERADVMLLDVMMPGTDGFEACRGLKAAAHPAYPGDHGDRARSTIRPGEGLEAGADDFLTKPVEDIALV